MPQPYEQEQGGEGAGDDAAAKASADAAAAAADAGKGEGDGEEVITMKKSDLKKIEEDRDNYRQGLLQKKADERSLDGGKKPDVDSGAGNVIDEKKVSETATAAANAAMRSANERTAKRAFLRDHPEYVDDGQWTSLLSHLTFRGGEVTYDDIVDRMEAAVLEHKRSTGKLEDYLKSEHERGLREGRAQSGYSGYGAGGAGDRKEGGGEGKLSQAGEQMARAMHVDPEKVKKADYAKDNVIDVL